MARAVFNKSVAARGLGAPWGPGDAQAWQPGPCPHRPRQGAGQAGGSPGHREPPWGQPVMAACGCEGEGSGLGRGTRVRRRWGLSGPSSAVPTAGQDRAVGNRWPWGVLRWHPGPQAGLGHRRVARASEACECPQGLASRLPKPQYFVLVQRHTIHLKKNQPNPSCLSHGL